jgi:CDP-diacylglycerol--glycerol-3-phosphate 3-phosphatidyltransferase
VFYRALAIILAMVTDCLDGYLARRFHTITRLGTILDPLMDKFFVGFITCVFIYEDRLQLWQAAALLSRDIAISLFAIYLAIKNTWGRFKIQSIWCGKISTTLQFLILLGLSFQMVIPSFMFFILILLGNLAWAELYLIEKRSSNTLA